MSPLDPLRSLSHWITQRVPLWRALSALIVIAFGVGVWWTGRVQALHEIARAVTLQDVAVLRLTHRFEAHEEAARDSIRQMRADLSAGLAVLRAMGRATCRESPRLAERYDYPCQDLLRSALTFPGTGRAP